MPVNNVSIIEGTLRPNLVVVFDNQRRFEFRVQCEVELPNEQQAMDIVRQLRSNDPNLLREARKTVLEIAEHKTTDVSKEIIGTAFDKCIHYLEQHPKPPQA